MNERSDKTAQLLRELVEHIQEKVAVQEREEIIAILSETEFTSLDHMPSEAALIIRMRGVRG